MNNMLIIGIAGLLYLLMGCNTVETRTVPVYNNTKPQIACVEPVQFEYVKCTADTILECIAENTLLLKKNVSEWKKYKVCIKESVGE